MTHTFVGGYDIPNYDSKFIKRSTFCESRIRRCVLQNQGRGIFFCDINVDTRILQHDAQQFFMTHISRMDEDIHNYDLSSVDEKDQDQYGKCAIRLECLLQMTYLYEMIPIILHLECIMEVVWLTIWYSQKVSWITSINN